MSDRQKGKRGRTGVKRQNKEKSGNKNRSDRRWKKKKKERINKTMNLAKCFPNKATTETTSGDKYTIMWK